ncbi:hypothetical protein [Legionella sp. CNM-4043-24]|uniref:hypothetical protein n=1 Tax=Legionella sp. CNM-4043-24 TaxID=3421646 RepID=UPI00403A80A9
MTIFLAKIKPELINILKNTTTETIKADNSLANKTITFFSLGYCGRDTVVAGKKRSKVDDCILALQIMVDQGSDEKNYLQMKHLLEKSKENATGVSDEVGFGAGITASGVEKALNILEHVYNKYRNMALTDIPDDKDPYHICCRYLGVYLADKVIEALKPPSGPVGKVKKIIAEHPQMGAGHLVTMEKEKHIKATLIACREKLEREHRKTAEEYLDSPDYHAARRDILIAQLEKLRTDNISVCTSHGVSLDIPVVSTSILSASVATPSVGATAGTLEDAIAGALRDIMALDPAVCEAELAGMAL